jgi:YHS domain-containing protein
MMVRLNDVSEHLAALSLEPPTRRIAPDDERAMRDRYALTERLAVAATPLHQRIVRPMLDELTQRFSNAVASHYRTPGGVVSECRFTHTSRYPATARVSIAIEWDPTTADVWLRYGAELLPALIPHDGHERRDIGLTPPGPSEVRRWVEAKLLGFVDAYLQVVAVGPALQRGALQTDPVCGMPVERGASPHSYTLDGHTFWLCSAVCRDVLAANPSLFLVGRVQLASGPGPAKHP